MPTGTIIYGVLHSQRRSNRAIRVIQPQISSKNRIGLESTESDLDLYRRIRREHLTPKKAETLLKKELIQRLQDFFHRLIVKDNYKEETQNDYLSNHFFWFRLYNAIFDSNAEINGLGSEKRISRLEELFIQSPHYGDYDKDLPYHMILGPHFDKFLAKRITEGGYDRVVLGITHAYKVAEKTESELVNVNVLYPNLKKNCDALEGEYRGLDDERRRQVLLDLRD